MCSAASKRLLVAALAAVALADARAAFAQPPSPSPAPVPAPTPTPDPKRPGRRDLTELSLSDLADVEVMTVTRRPESRARTAAAVHVITGDDIRRSGAVTLADALRLVPGVQVSRLNANQWAIGVRGFASRLARSVLVLIDGRSVYTPLFAGTYWEVQDLLLEDVDRIEVIRGPGGTLWGANAVNGVVNVITKHARDTSGVFLMASAGNEERVRVGGRWGGPLGDNGHARAYGKFFDRDAAFHPDGREFDGWRHGQGGFRADLGAAGGSLTLQGDLYAQRTGQRTTFASYSPPFARTVERTAAVSGGNLRGLWSRELGAGSEVSALAYYDRTRREEANFEEDRDTLDFELQYRRPLPRQQVMAGVGYRMSLGRTGGVETIRFVPPDRTDHLFSAFVLDEVRLKGDALALTVGFKLERNSYSRYEGQPSVRLLYQGGRHVVWSAVSRAVRTPSRLERDLEATVATDPSQPVFARALGSSDFVAEKVIAYEAGYRFRASEHLFAEVSGFSNDYDDLLSFEPGSPFRESGTGGSRTILPFLAANGLEGEVKGLEVAVDARLSSRWSVYGAYSLLDIRLRPTPTSGDTTLAAAQGDSPRHMFVLRSSLSARGMQLDAVVRRLSGLANQDVPAYTELDARVAWRPNDVLELALVGRDLLQDHHPEFGGGVEIERSVRAEATWRF